MVTGQGKKGQRKLSKPREDLQLLRKQILSQSVLQEEQLDHKRELMHVPGGRNRARQGSKQQHGPP
jgi:hypothetical protein